MNNLAESPIFIVGHPRSGTTLLLSLLDSHPDLLVYPRETQFFNLVLPLFKLDPAQALDFLIWDTAQVPWYAAHLYESGRRIAQFHGRLRQLVREGDGSPKALLQATILAHAQVTDQTHKRFWVEKTPHSARYAKTIFRWFPMAKIISVVRDPRATYASLLGYQKIMHQRRSGALRFCVEWQMSLRTSCMAAHFPTLTVRYEDLVDDTRGTMLRICEFLGIAYHQSLLHPTFDGASFTGFSSYSSYATQFKMVERSSLAKWKAVLTKRDVRVIEYLLAKDMAAWGYSGDGAALPQRAPELALLYRALQLIGQPAIHVPELLLKLARGTIGLPAGRLDGYIQLRQTAQEEADGRNR